MPSVFWYSHLGFFYRKIFTIQKKNHLLSAAKTVSEEYQFWYPDNGLLASRTVKQYIFVI